MSDGEKHRVSIMGNFTEEKTRPIIRILENSKDGDEVHLLLVSCMGGGDSLFGLLDALRTTKAKVTTGYSFMIASGAVLVLFSGDEMEINPSSSDLFLTAFQDRWSKKPDKFTERYRHELGVVLRDFLTQQEFDLIGIARL